MSLRYKGVAGRRDTDRVTEPAGLPVRGRGQQLQYGFLEK